MFFVKDLNIGNIYEYLYDDERKELFKKYNNPNIIYSNFIEEQYIFWYIKNKKRLDYITNLKIYIPYEENLNLIISINGLIYLKDNIVISKYNYKEKCYFTNKLIKTNYWRNDIPIYVVKNEKFMNLDKVQIKYTGIILKNPFRELKYFINEKIFKNYCYRFYFE